jgi:hypothetical protein
MRKAYSYNAILDKKNVERNIKSLKNFPVSKNTFTIGRGSKSYTVKYVTIPDNINLYQGTDFDFTEKSRKYKSVPLVDSINSFKDEKNYIYKINHKDSQINEFYKYYDKRNDRSYFLSSYKKANLYGLDKDYSTIVYAADIDYKNISKPSSTVSNIYPLYFIAKKCYTIKYKTEKQFNLLNIGDLDTIQLLWTLIPELPSISNEAIEDYRYYLYVTCAYDDDINPNILPTTLYRNSDHSDDMKLLELLKKFETFFLSKGISINGWIYYKTDIFHQEILFFNRTGLKIEEIYTRNLIKPNGIPTYEKYMEKFKDLIIPYNIKVKKNIILHNFTIPQPQ